VFLGHYSPESAGDYASGTNHTLPTGGYARACGGVGVESFMKQISFQEFSPRGLAALAPTIEVMAAREGLFAHRNAVRIRREGERP
jgi:histidinol dehydrogenase